VITTDIDQRFLRWFWSGVGIWTAILVIALPGDAVTTWAAFVLVLPILGALFAFDMVQHRLPLALSHSALVLFVSVVGVGSIIHGDSRILGVVAGATIMGLVGAMLGRRSRMFGRGDVHLCPLLGAMVGWFDPRGVMVAMLATTVIGAVVATALLVLRRVERHALIAYGPFLMFGTMVAMVGSSRL
jgi:leader peptidase (prepilin peptidase)/N-methyltransferase